MIILKNIWCTEFDVVEGIYDLANFEKIGFCRILYVKKIVGWSAYLHPM